jgi:hypothetical protein
MLGSRSAYKKRHRYYRKTDSRPDQAYGMQFQLPRFTNFSEKVHDNQAAALTQYGRNSPTHHRPGRGGHGREYTFHPGFAQSRSKRDQFCSAGAGHHRFDVPELDR